MLKTDFTPVYSMRNLEQFGINALTGESCAFSLRVLCDVNAEGLALLQEYFGAPSLTLADNWNTTVFGEPAVGSIMLPRSITKDLAQFALFRAGALGVAISADGTLIGIFDAQRLADYSELSLRPENTGSQISVHRNPRANVALGTRNEHVMTGRTH